MKNTLLLDALEGKKVPRPPVWLMRQAGRYLPDFMKLKEKYDFFTRCQTPELATEITIMPIEQIGSDAAILFSDILVVPQAMGVAVEMKEGIGPWLPNPIRTEQDVLAVKIPDVQEKLSYVFESIKLTKKALSGNIPLIGFAGSPWTILCYMIQGQGSKDFSIAKTFCYQHPLLAHQLLDKITQTTVNYLKQKVTSGADAIQIFDSWGGLLSAEDYTRYSLPYIQKIVKALKPLTKVILFAKGCHHSLSQINKSQPDAIGLDWTVPAEYARRICGARTLQGNMDPSILMAPISEIQKQTKRMIDGFGKQNYIVNLGHGILPTTPVAHAKAFIESVKSY